MRMIALIVILLVFGPTEVPAQAQAETQAQAQDAHTVAASIQSFDDGTALVREGRFREAIDAFERSRAAGFESEALWYNMGVAHYRLDHLGQAILHFERALRLAPDDERVLHSLSIAERRRVDTFSKLPEPFWKRGHTWLLGIMGPWAWFAAGVVLLWTAIALAVMRAIPAGWNMDTRQIQRWCLMLAAPLLVFSLWSSVSPPVPPAAIVLAQTTSITEQPDAAGAVVEPIHEGTRVHLLTDAGDWLLVRLSNSVEGWLPATDVGRI